MPNTPRRSKALFNHTCVSRHSAGGGQPWDEAQDGGGEGRGPSPRRKKASEMGAGKATKDRHAPLLLLRLGLGVQLGPSAITRTGRQKEVSSLGNRSATL